MQLGTSVRWQLFEHMASYAQRVATNETWRIRLWHARKAGARCGVYVSIAHRWLDFPRHGLVLLDDGDDRFSRSVSFCFQGVFELVEQTTLGSPFERVPVVIALLLS